MRLVLPLVLLATATPALAGQLPLWSRRTFPLNGGDLAGTDGWENGYPADTWRGSRQPSGEYALPKTDANVSDVGPDKRAWGSGGPTDNWIVRGETFEDGAARIDVASYDNDAVGLVLSHSGPSTFYVLFLTSDAAPPPINQVRNPSMILLRVEGGQVTELGRSTDVPDLSDDGEDLRTVRLQRNDGRLTAFFDGPQRINVVDPNPLPPGRAGMWSYDAGDDTQGAVAYYDIVETFRFDDDDDGVADDEDNCENNPNAGQADRDNDGIGDDCDEDGPDPTDEPTDEPTDTDDTDVTVTDDPSGETDGPGPDDTDPSGNGYLDEDLVATCEGCASTSPPAALALGLGLLALRRRRR